MSGALPPPPLNAPRGSKRWIFYQSLNGHREGPGTLTPSPALPPRRAPCFPPDTTWGREARLCSGTSSQCLPGCVRQRNVSAVNYKPKGSITLSPDGTSLNMSNRAVSLLQPEAGSCFPGEEKLRGGLEGDFSGQPQESAATDTHDLLSRLGLPSSSCWGHTCPRP